MELSLFSSFTFKMLLNSAEREAPFCSLAAEKLKKPTAALTACSSICV